MIQIRDEFASDFTAVDRVTVEAFSKSEFGHNGEADLVDAIRSAQPDAISLVAIEAGELVGHLISSPATIETPNGIVCGTAIGPVSVIPSYQRQGIAGALIAELIARVASLEYCFVAVAGHPDYYPRFGFKTLSTYGIRHCFHGMPDEVFFIRLLHETNNAYLNGGTLKYCPEFGPQDRFA